FLKYGFKSVTMSDISKELGISKKTLYQSVENKDDLINKVILNHISEEKEVITGIIETSQDAIDEIFQVSTYMNQMLKRVNPSAIFDLRKYYRTAWDIIQEFNDGYIYTMIKRNIQRGMSEGLYRNDIRPDIVAKLYLGMSQLITDPDVFPYPEYNQAELHLICLDHHLRGLIKPEAQNIIKQYEKATKSK
ncbi:MAG: TetR/AcrR family transcriptional regulator, partial [Bacteroidota bacterium]